MTPKNLKRAELLYKRYKTETFEYRELARRHGMNTSELNRQIWQILHDRRYPPIRTSEEKYPARRKTAAPGECAYCDSCLASGETMFPSHDAYRGCESGKRNHCTCDMCW